MDKKLVYFIESLFEKGLTFKEVSCNLEQGGINLDGLSLRRIWKNWISNSSYKPNTSVFVNNVQLPNTYTSPIG